MGAEQFGVLLVAMFLVPKLMSVIPDFDPLMAIVGLFGILALLQHLGFAGANSEGSEPSPRPRNGRGADEAPASGGRAAQGRQKEPTAKELLADAERCLAQNSWAKVEEIARRVTDLDPEIARAWELLATAQRWEGRREEAAATVRKARELYEVESVALKELAKELATSTDPAKHAAECEAKGEAFVAKRNYDLAAECYGKAVEALGDAQPSDDAGRQQWLRLRRRRAECAQQLQDWSACRRDSTTLLEADPRDAKALLMRAASNEALEKFKAALEDARLLLSLEPKSAAANRIVHNCQQALRA